MRHGFLLIDKPLGPTSHDIVAKVRKQLGERAVGHLGTLDPEASGLMVLGIGNKALKVIELYNHLPKEYEALIQFGAVSTTYDATGKIEAQPMKAGWSPPDLPTLRRTLEERFTGRISQIPPMYSAVHIDGVRAYDLARQGKSVEMKSRTVEIDYCGVLMYEFPQLKLSVRCSSGTYIRSLAHDLGAFLRCGGYLTALRRTKVGEWKVENAVTTEYTTWADVLPLKDILSDFPRVDLSEHEYKEIGFGRSIQQSTHEEVIAWYEELPVAILHPVQGKEGMILRPRKVF